MARSDWLGLAFESLAVAAGFFFGGPKWGVAFLVLGSVALVIWHRTRDRVGLSWTEIETRIKELRQREFEHHRDSGDGRRVDAVQLHDDDGTNPRWGLMGSSKELRADVERLFRIAGHKLKSVGIASSPRLKREKDDLSRWLWFLVEVGDHKKDITTTSVHDGKQVQTHSYWLHDVLDDALAGCVEAMKREVTR